MDGRSHFHPTGRSFIGAIKNDGGGSNSDTSVFTNSSAEVVKTGEDIDGLSTNDETGFSISLSENGEISPWALEKMLITFEFLI